MNSLGGTHAHTYTYRHVYIYYTLLQQNDDQRKTSMTTKTRTQYTHTGEYIIYLVFSSMGKKYRRVILWGWDGCSRYYIPPIATLNYYYFTIYIYRHSVQCEIRRIRSSRDGLSFCRKIDKWQWRRRKFRLCSLFVLLHVHLMYIYIHTYEYTPQVYAQLRISAQKSTIALAPLSTITTTADTNRLVNFGFACAHSICTHFTITV